MKNYKPELKNPLTAANINKAKVTVKGTHKNMQDCG